MCVGVDAGTPFRGVVVGVVRHDSTVCRHRRQQQRSQHACWRNTADPGRVWEWPISWRCVGCETLACEFSSGGCQRSTHVPQQRGGGRCRSRFVHHGGFAAGRVNHACSGGRRRAGRFSSSATSGGRCECAGATCRPHTKVPPAVVAACTTADEGTWEGVLSWIYVGGDALGLTSLAAARTAGSTSYYVKFVYKIAHAHAALLHGSTARTIAPQPGVPRR